MHKAYSITMIRGGVWTVSDGNRSVRVEYYRHRKGWLAIAAWNRSKSIHVRKTRKAAIADAMEIFVNWGDI